MTDLVAFVIGASIAVNTVASARIALTRPPTVVVTSPVSRFVFGSVFTDAWNASFILYTARTSGFKPFSIVIPKATRMFSMIRGIERRTLPALSIDFSYAPATLVPSSRMALISACCRCIAFKEPVATPNSAA